MEIKRLDHLSKDECRDFLHNNPNSELTKIVQGRLNDILAAEEQERQREESERKASIVLKNKWIDINQFLEETKYRNKRGLINVFASLFLICLSVILITLYFTNGTHQFYGYSDDIQCNNVYGLENILLNLKFIKTPYWYSSGMNFPTWNNYQLGNTFLVFFIYCGFFLFMFIITIFCHSSLIGIIYNIEDGTKSDIFRPIQNKEGKCGLCELGNVRLKKLLSFQYDLICPAKENSFVCCRDSKYGLYNAVTEKMVIPIEYDNIYSIGDSVIKLIKNGEVFAYSYKGYRIIE